MAKFVSFDNGVSYFNTDEIKSIVGLVGRVPQTKVFFKDGTTQLLNIPVAAVASAIA